MKCLKNNCKNRVDLQYELWFNSGRYGDFNSIETSFMACFFINQSNFGGNCYMKQDYCVDDSISGEKKYLHIELCSGCIDMLEEYNPYIYPNGDGVPLENIVPIVVGIKDCCNEEKNLAIDKCGVFHQHKNKSEEVL